MSERIIDIGSDPTFENVNEYWKAFQERQAKLPEKPETSELEELYDPRLYDVTTWFDLHCAILESNEKRPAMAAFNREGLNAEIGLTKEAAEVLEAAQLFREKLGSELADCFIYLQIIADKHDINLFQEVVDKLKHNDERFPPDQFQGGAEDFKQTYRDIKQKRGERIIYQAK